MVEHSPSGNTVPVGVGEEDHRSVLADRPSIPGARIAAIDVFVVQVPAAYRPALAQLNACKRTEWGGLNELLQTADSEAVLIRLTTDCGLTGWGETQAPLAPQTIRIIVERLLRPMLLDTEFGGTTAEIEYYWSRLYTAMRTLGQTGGLMMDAMCAVDLALWDLAGKMAGLPVAQLLSRDISKSSIPAFVSGLPGDTSGRRADAAQMYFDQGFHAFKLFHNRDYESFLQDLWALHTRLGPEATIAVDTLWRLAPWSAVAFGRLLDEQHSLWLENPLPAQQYTLHADLARSIRTPLAVGETYRSCYDLAPFFQARGMQIVRPDVGRCGLTEAYRMAEVATVNNKDVIPFAGSPFGPQLAAAIHLAAAAPNCRLMEFRPSQVAIANTFLQTPLIVSEGVYRLPEAPGLGVCIERFTQGTAAAASA